MKSKVYSYVRFSSSPQSIGSSEARQLEKGEEYAAKRGWTVSKSFPDRAVSGWTGENRQEGSALAELLKVVKPGDYILIEDNDRFSRERPITAMYNLQQITDKGTTVIFVKENREVNRENFDALHVLFPNIFKSMSANDEIKKISGRVADAWAKKRTNHLTNENRKFTGRCVGWLEPVYELREVKGEDGKTKQAPVCIAFKRVPERVKIVKQIFEWAAAGMGKASITLKLNKRKVKPFGYGKCWSPTHITRTLTNRAVLGEFTPGTRKKGEKRTLLNDKTVKGYYPPIIGEALFHKVQKILQARNRGGGLSGYQGKGGFNVFSHLAFDKDSGCLMCYVNKNKDAGQHYLVARDAVLGTGKAKYISWQYDKFLSDFLAVCKRTVLMPPPKPNEVDDKLAEVLMGIEDVQKRINTLVTYLESGKMGAEEVSARIRALKAKRSEMETERQKLESETLADTTDATQIDWQDTDRLRDNLRATVERITVDAATKSFHVKFLDGRECGLTREDGRETFNWGGNRVVLDWGNGTLGSKFKKGMLSIHIPYTGTVSAKELKREFAELMKEFVPGPAFSEFAEQVNAAIDKALKLNRKAAA